MAFEEADARFPYHESNMERNDHYVFLLCEMGHAKLIVDFKNIILKTGFVYFSVPGQITHRIYDQCLAGWYLAVDTSLLCAEYRNVFRVLLGSQIPLKLKPTLLNQALSILGLISNRIDDGAASPFEEQVTHSLILSFIGMVAGVYSQQGTGAAQNSRAVQISHEFRSLLADHFRTLKTPAQYAEKLNITSNYLNEAVKKATGFPVSYWIIAEILTEAKRLLFQSSLTVKEIAGEVGFREAAYFSRFFKKHEGYTPGDYRSKKHWIVQSLP